MVAYGEQLIESRRPGWEDAYVDYDGLKHLLEQIEDGDGDMLQLKTSFRQKLRLEIEKVSLFTLSRQGEIAQHIGSLRLEGQVEHLKLLQLPSTDLLDETAYRPMFPPLNLSQRSKNDLYTQWGVELLHLQRFVCVNAMGFRKIIKKYHKTLVLSKDPFDSKGGLECHLHHLANSDSVSAIHSSLNEACEEFLEPDERFRMTVRLIQVLRDYAHRMNETFVAFLSNKSLIHNSLQQDTQYAITLFLKFQPDLILKLDLNDLRSTSNQVVDETRDEGFGGVNTVSLVINLVSTLLYTVNYYIVAPTSNRYAILLGMDGAFGATLVGAASLSAIFAAIFYSWWYTQYSFRSALLFSTLCPFIGNLLYALAISYHSMPMAMLGRILVGFGSAEVVNRQLISVCISHRYMITASAWFVAAGASGMSIGPLLAAILDLSAGRDMDVDISLPLLPAGGIIYNHVTSPGFVMAILWFVQGMALTFSFREPQRVHASSNASNSVRHRSKTLENLSLTRVDYGSISSSTFEASDSGNQESGSAWSELRLVQKLVFHNVALPITLLLFGFIELADEVLISSCSMVCRRYFGWHGSTAGFIIASLGALVLPAHFIVEKAAHHFEERWIMKYAILFICISLFAILNFEGLIFDTFGLAATFVERSKTDSFRNETNPVDISIGGESIMKFLNKHKEVPYDWGAGAPVYLVFLSAIFMGTIILEGVDTSLMAKAAPPALNNTFFNSGLLATLIGTLGRVCGDSMITVSALLDRDPFTDFVNATFMPMIPLVLIGYVLVKRFYNELF